MTPEQLGAKLNELIALPAEVEWVEFKQADQQIHFNELGKYSEEEIPPLEQAEKRTRAIEVEELKTLPPLADEEFGEGRAHRNVW